MFNSKLKLKGYSLEEMLHEGVYGNIPELSIDDWQYLEYILEGYSTPEQVDTQIQNQLDATADCNYNQGYSDGCGDYYYENQRLKALLKENNIEY